MCAAKKRRLPSGTVLALEQHNVLNDSGDVSGGWFYGGSSQQSACVSVNDAVGFTGRVFSRMLVSVNDAVDFTGRVLSRMLVCQ